MTTTPERPLVCEGDLHVEPIDIYAAGFTLGDYVESSQGYWIVHGLVGYALFLHAELAKAKQTVADAEQKAEK